ncbi:hypothetical protein Cgig2_014636 [Carnegiea gigantea]|uniref:Uncharacterized protein n=1 Tax=Carnegiea gigantea TaxID=171969 RepID=A0A9Q1L0E4_9CARY|nr:hypothetical protein Cgig2_014636 [Carnegiea gigantea]
MGKERFSGLSIIIVLKKEEFEKALKATVLGFGGNVISLIVLAITGVLRRDGPGSLKISLPERFLVLVPALGACVSLIDVALISWELFNGRRVAYLDLIYRSSQLSVWALWMVKECLVFLLDVAFGITINILRVRRPPSNRIDKIAKDGITGRESNGGSATGA